MEVFEAIRTILAVRQFDSRPVPDDAVRRILESGRLTGSSMNRQPWRFIAVQQAETLQQLGQLARSGPYIAGAALAIVIAIEESPFAVSDASRAAQSMMLTAWADGIGSNWVGFHGFESVKPLLGIPDDLDVLAILAFGYRTGALPKGEKQRKPLGEVARWEHYSTPFE